MDTIAGPKFVVVLGRPSEGKSLLLYQFARQECAAIQQRAADRGVHWVEGGEYVLFVGLEEDGAEVSRLVAGDQHGPVDYALGLVGEDVLRAEARNAVDVPMYVMNEHRANVWGSEFASAALSGEAIWEDIQALYRSTGLKPSLICVDYLQLLGLEASDQRHEVAKNARACRLLARQLAVPVVLASQARRAVDSSAREGFPPIPEIGDSEWSAVAEQSCDVLMSLTRPARWPEKLVKKYTDDGYGPWPFRSDITYDVTEDLVLLQLLKQKGGRRGRSRFMLSHDFATNKLRSAIPREERRHRRSYENAVRME
ncbi:MAG: hypothetical protein IPG34_19730 [Rhodocyclaceae bacterium]|nr:hypothetical protein [Rhodocyclaceae bacterium]